MVMLDERIDKLTIDAAAEKFACQWPIDWPSGGLDICLAVATCCVRNSVIPCRRRQPGCGEGRKGRTRRKTGKGFTSGGMQGDKASGSAVHGAADA